MKMLTQTQRLLAKGAIKGKLSPSPIADDEMEKVLIEIEQKEINVSELLGMDKRTFVREVVSFIRA